MVKVVGVTHWSISVNDLEESERFYSEVLGLEYRGRLGTSGMACLRAGDHEVLLCQRREPLHRTAAQENNMHHSFTVSPADWEDGARELHRLGVPLMNLVYRDSGFFTGRELYFLDPSGNLLEIRDPSWQAGMPTPTIEDIVSAPHTATS